MPPKPTSRLQGMYKLSPAERLAWVSRAAQMDKVESEALRGDRGLSLDQADHMVENVVGIFGLPLGIAVNFLVNGREVLVPMAIEEPSVVAGASFMAKLARDGGGFLAETTEPEMIAQMQILDVPDIAEAQQALIEAKPEVLAQANLVDPLITELGGGARDLEVRLLEETPAGPMLVVHLIFDTRDAMGANTLNTAAERLSPMLEAITRGRVHLRILSNLADRRLAKATCRIPSESLAFGKFSGELVGKGIVEAWALAAADPYRAATHNKGIMNGVDSVLIATGNDWRAVEAGAHAYASRSGRYTSLSRWRTGEGGSLEGTLEMPMAVGIVGGATQVHPTAKACVTLMGVQTGRELAEVIVSVGLAQNLAALRALGTEGIQRGHMRLHARQVAIAAGAEGAVIERLARVMVEEGTVRMDRAKQLMAELNKSN